MMRGRNPTWRSDNSGEDHYKGHGNKQRTMDIRKWDSGDDISEASEEGEEDSGDELDEEDVRVKLASTKPRKDGTFRMQNVGRLSDASSGSDGEIFGGSEGDELWESEDEKDHHGKVSKDDAYNYHSGVEFSGEEEFSGDGRSKGRTVEESKKKSIDESWDSD